MDYILVDKERIDELNAKLDGLISTMAQHNDETMDAAEAAAYLHIHLGTLYRLTREHVIPAMHIGRRYIYSSHQLRKYLCEQTNEKR